MGLLITCIKTAARYGSQTGGLFDRFRHRKRWSCLPSYANQLVLTRLGLMSDYERIARAISYIVERAETQPTLEEMAASVDLSTFHFQRMFARWAGTTPKRYLQVLTLQRAKQLLRESRSVLEVSDTVGLSSGSRLYDHFVHLDAVTPGEFKAGGAGLAINHAVHETPFGEAFIATTGRGVCSLGFLDYEDKDEILGRLRRKWPEADLCENGTHTREAVRSIFSRASGKDKPISASVSGTNFQVSVWKALLRIPSGKVTTYAEVARSIGRPGSARAVGQAIGANPVAFLIPCHRVIRASGRLGGYHWGEARKHAIHAWEAAAG